MMARFINVWHLCLFLICNNGPIAIGDDNNSTCLQSIYKLEALPGHGWDSLRNKEMGRVFQFTYNQCRKTEDGKYLIPDSTYVVAIKDSNLQTTSDLFEHFSDYSSVTSSSLKIDAGFSLGGFGAQGSYETDYMEAKSHQVKDKSMTTRIQERNNIYMIQSSPDSTIDPVFKSIIDEVIEAAKMTNNSKKTELLCQFIVRDYGTHYIEQINAGAILLKEDFINSTFVLDQSENKLEIKAAAGASFCDMFNADVKYSYEVDTKFKEEYLKQRTSSNIRSIGGALITSNMSLNDWIKEIPNNLVVIDRSGSPLPYLITPKRFPSVPLNILKTVRQQLDQAVKDYYSYNTHYGCTDVNSPYFDYNANVNNNDCQKISDYGFGGGYFVCLYPNSWCTIFQLQQVKNPFTGQFSCPIGYEAIPLTTDTSRGSMARVGYWCVSATAPKVDTGVLFGGLFTSRTTNPITKAKTCPVSYIPLQLAADLQVCVSNDYINGNKYSVPFGGFFSCQNGNPLSSTPELRNNTRTVRGDLKTCPKGYSQRLAVVDGFDCPIHYCIKFNSTVGHIDIVLPPFLDPTDVLFDNANANANENHKELHPAEKKVDTTLSGGTIAGIVIGALVVLITIIGVLVVKRAWQRSAFDSDRLRKELVPSSNYGTADTTEGV